MFIDAVIRSRKFSDFCGIYDFAVRYIKNGKILGNVCAHLAVFPVPSLSVVHKELSVAVKSKFGYIIVIRCARQIDLSKLFAQVTDGYEKVVAKGAVPAIREIFSVISYSKLTSSGINRA